jgi:hypothetical protein
LNLTVGGVMAASNVELDLELLGGMKFSNLDAGSSGWTLVDDPATITNTLRIKVNGVLQPGQVTPRVTVTTIFPDLNQTILRQYANVTWNDQNGYGARGRLMEIPIDLSHHLPPPVSMPPTPVVPATLPTADPAFASVDDPGPTATNAQNWYFAVTSHTLNDDLGFLTYWLGHGSVTVLGFPLSEVYTDADTHYQSQYFERGVLEYHPENPDPYKVELRSLGRELGQVQASISPGQAPSAGSTFYAATGHWLDGRFASFWQSNGGLMQFGYPITEPQVQADGTVVQWFERARFEYSLTVTGYPQVKLGLVGHESAVALNYLPY